jgi:hypothetical protein
MLGRVGGNVLVPPRLWFPTLAVRTGGVVLTVRVAYFQLRGSCSALVSDLDLVPWGKSQCAPESWVEFSSGLSA